MVFSEVLKDYVHTFAKDFDSLNAETQELLRHGTMAQLKATLKQEMRVEEQRVANQLETLLKAQEKERRSNKHFLCALDNGFRQGFGHGLARYIPTQPLRPLQAGQKRYMVSVDVAGQGLRKRVCLQNADGARQLEYNLRLLQGIRQAPCLHMAADQGPVGMAGIMWMLHAAHLRGTCTFDLCHRLVNDILDSQAASSLVVVKCQFAQVNRMRKGPFRVGGANYSVLRESAREMFKVLEHENVLLEALFFPAVEGL